MKSILIVAHAMNLGGIERSLLGLLRSIDYNEFKVDLFLMRHEGELLKEIPKEVNLLKTKPECTCYAKPLKAVIKKGHVLMAAGRLFAKYKAKRFLRKNGKNKTVSSVELEYSHKYTMKFIGKLQQDKVYDLAISFATPHYFVRDKVKAKKKAAWIHTDYSTIEIDQQSEVMMWGAFDYIVGVSEMCVQSFKKEFPSLVDKVLVVENILVPDSVRMNSLKQIEDIAFVVDDSYVNLLSVGRFDKAKNFEAVPEVVAGLKNKGIQVRWYLIGFGSTESEIEKNRHKFSVEENVIILGKRDNPYPYMKSCDVYVQPSIFEGKCVAVREAQILEKPVVITNYKTAKSQVENGINGYIIEQGTENIISGLFELLSNRDKLLCVSKNCSNGNFGNKEEVEKIYRMIEE